MNSCPCSLLALWFTLWFRAPEFYLYLSQLFNFSLRICYYASLGKAIHLSEVAFPQKTYLRKKYIYFFYLRISLRQELIKSPKLNSQNSGLGSSRIVFPSTVIQHFQALSPRQRCHPSSRQLSSHCLLIWPCSVISSPLAPQQHWMLGHNGNVEESEELHDLVSFPFAAGRKRKNKAKGGDRHTVEWGGAVHHLSHGELLRGLGGVCLSVLHMHTCVEVYTDNHCPSCHHFFLSQSPSRSPLRSLKKVTSTNVNYILHDCSSHKCPVLFYFRLQNNHAVTLGCQLHPSSG